MIHSDVVGRRTRWRKRRWATGTLMLLTIASGVFGAGLYLHSRGLDWADKFGSATSMLLALVALLHPQANRIILWMRGRSAPSDTSLDQVRNELAAILARHGATDDRQRRVHDPRPLPVRWTSEDQTASGLYAGIADRLRASSTGRLVILGPAGAGKSVLVVKLARDLLVSRDDHDPVPLIVNAAAWHPDENFGDWIESELEGRFPSLAAPVATPAGPTPLARLLAQGEVMPIIDGLDELPESLRVRAIADLNAYGSDHPLVMTSRPDEYTAAVETFGRPVAGTEVVTLLPLDVEDCKAYLVEATAAGPDRWTMVFAQLDRDPDGPLGTVLSNPLMLWLARTIYEDAAADPAALLGYCGSTGELEEHLLSSLVPAVYGRQRHPGPRRAVRWLREVASWTYWHGENDEAREIAWWRLGWWKSHPVFTVVALLRATMLSAILTTVSGHAAQAYREDPAGAVAATRDFLSDGPLGRMTYSVVASAVRTVEADFPGTVDATVRLLPAPGLPAAFWFVLGTVVIWARSRGSGPTPTTVVLRPGRLSLHLLYLSALSLLVLPLSGSAVDVPAGLVLFGGFVSVTLVLRADRLLLDAIDLSEQVDPYEVWRTDRQATFLVGLVRAAALIALVTLLIPGEVAVILAAGYLALLGLRHLVGSIRPRRSACERYAAARLLLWSTGRGPRNPLAFFAEAHGHGVLRQSGPAYRFRHLRLTEHLAGPPRTPSTVARVGYRWFESMTERLFSTSHAQLRCFGLRVTRQGPMTWKYEDPRVDRWARTGHREESAWREMSVVTDTAGRIVGERPDGWRILVAAVLLPFLGRERSRRRLSRYARPLTSDAVTGIGGPADWSDGVLASFAPPPRRRASHPDLGEQVIRVQRMHPSLVGRRLAVGLGSALLMILLFRDGRPELNLVEAGTVMIACLAVVWAVWQLLDFHTHRLLITDRRIVVEAGVISQWVTEWPIAAIADITCTQSLAGRLWGSGTIRLALQTDTQTVTTEEAPLGRLLGYRTLVTRLGSHEYAMPARISGVGDSLHVYREIIDLVEAKRAATDSHTAPGDVAGVPE